MIERKILNLKGKLAGPDEAVPNPLQISGAYEGFSVGTPAHIPPFGAHIRQRGACIYILQNSHKTVSSIESFVGEPGEYVNGSFGILMSVLWHAKVSECNNVDGGNLAPLLLTLC